MPEDADWLAALSLFFFVVCFLFGYYYYFFLNASVQFEFMENKNTLNFKLDRVSQLLHFEESLDF